MGKGGVEKNEIELGKFMGRGRKEARKGLFYFLALLLPTLPFLSFPFPSRLP
jgi:hypothetical protein